MAGKKAPLRHPNIDDVRGFASRLQQLRERFSKNAAAFAFEPPIEEVLIRDFERRESIELPPDYRVFITEIGSGGGGFPGEGLFSPLEPLTPSLYGLRDPFPEPHSTDESVMPMIGGLLPLGSDGCSAEHALVVAGTAHGQVWTYLEDDRPGWVPFLGGQPVSLDGRPLNKLKTKERELKIQSVLAEVNRPLRHTFASAFAEWLERCERGELE